MIWEGFILEWASESRSSSRLEYLNKSDLQQGQASSRLKLQLVKKQLALNLFVREGEVWYCVGCMVTLLLSVSRIMKWSYLSHFIMV